MPLGTHRMLNHPAGLSSLSLSAALVFSLLACGDPGADTVFVRALNGRGATPIASPPPKSSGPGRTISVWRGLYRRDGELSQFQPCGTARPLDVTGTTEGRVLLAERFRWNALWQGRPMYAVLRGAVVTDTLPTVADSTRQETVTRFFVTGVDTLRTWQNECPGMRAPR